MIYFLPNSPELSQFSHTLTVVYPPCRLVCSYIGRAAFNNLILMFPSLGEEEIAIKVLSACKSIISISESTVSF